MILVDTSAWVEFDRATGSFVDTRLTELIATTDDVAVSEPVRPSPLSSVRVERADASDRPTNDQSDLFDRRPRPSARDDHHCPGG